MNKINEVNEMSRVVSTGGGRPKCSEQGGTLCWKCINAVPNREGTIGCPWSVDCKPIKGWKAIRSERAYKVYGIWDKTTESFIINEATNAPMKFTIRKKGIEYIKTSGNHNLSVRILNTIKKYSYTVKECPLFVKG